MKRQILLSCLLLTSLAVSEAKAVEEQITPADNLALYKANSQSVDANDNSSFVNTKVMLDGTCRATSWPASALIENSKLLASANQPRSISHLTNRGPIPNGKIVLRVYSKWSDAHLKTTIPAAKMTHSAIDIKQSITLVLANTTSKSHVFEVSDSRLYIVQEALDPQGQWRPIESLSKSTCGNSYYQISLESGEFWSFQPNRYTGTYKTKLRFRLIENLEGTIRTHEEKKPSMINHFSNEFDGSINLEQFNVLGQRYWDIPLRK